MPLAPGTKIDRYVVESLLGIGGMAEVYAVRHAALGSPAALKVLRLHSPQLIQRMVREGRAQARLQHPNVVPVLDLFEVDGAPGLLMERVEGPTLAQLLLAGPLVLERAERLARGLMAGLHAAHRLGIVHRDLKPANVLVAAGDTARIADFGLATAFAEDSDAGLTRPGTAIGTPAYMAPEQHEDAHTVDTRADVFALGVVLYEMVVGSAPAAGGNLLAAWHKMAQKRWRGPAEVDPTIPERIDRAIRWALEPDRDARAPSVAALWEVFFGEVFPTAPSTPAPHQPAYTVAESLFSPAPVSAVPKPARPLVGREDELARVLGPLDAHGSLVTLTGTAGVGKTRVAVEIAHRWTEHVVGAGAEARSAAWIDLQAARHEQELVQLVAWQLDDAGDASVATVGRALARRGPLLLVLDNLEQLPRAAGATISAWVRAAPSLRVLATSRQALGVAEERVVDLAPLEVPDRPEDVVGSPAWRLFTAVAPAGLLDRVEPGRAQRLLRVLEGLPLALELAGNRLEVLELEELERRMADRFSLLTDPSASGERHGALWDAIGWSWALLPEAERRALAQLSAFVGPFGLTEAEGVVEAGLPAIDALHGLIRRSLLRRTGPRFSMLASIREFAARQLDDDDRRAVFERHASWYGAVAVEIPFYGRRGSTRDVYVEQGSDLWAVLDRATTVPSLRADALKCAIGLAALYERRGPQAAVVRVVEQGLALELPHDDLWRSRTGLLRSNRCMALRRLGRIDDARQGLEQLLSEPIGAPLRSTVTAELADLFTQVGDPRGHATYELALALAREHGPPSVVATTSAAVALGLHAAGQREQAAALAAEALNALPPGNLRTEFEVRKADAWMKIQCDDLEGSEAQYQVVLRLAEELGDVRGTLYARGQLGLVAEARGRSEEAEQLYRTTAEGFSEQGDPVFHGYYLGYCGRSLLTLGRVAEGVAALERAIESGERMDPALRVTLWLALAFGYARDGRVEDAARAAGADPEHDEEGRSIPVAVARGFAALASGDRSAASGFLAEAEVAVEALVELPLLRLATRQIEALARELGSWRVTTDGGVVETPAGLRIEVGRHQANARILAHLVHRRTAAPGEATDADGLALAGWPGERIVPAAAANRVRVALSALRRAGLADLIERTEGGWRLDPAVELRVTSS